MLNKDMGSSGNQFGSSLVTSTFAATRSAAAHGDDFTAFLRLHTLITFFAFAPFSILIEDPEGNMVRSVDLYSFYIVYARLLESSGGTLVSRDPANARDVPAGPLVAPQSSDPTHRRDDET